MVGHVKIYRYGHTKIVIRNVRPGVLDFIRRYGGQKPTYFAMRPVIFDF